MSNVEKLSFYFLLIFSLGCFCLEIGAMNENNEKFVQELTNLSKQNMDITPTIKKMNVMQKQLEHLHGEHPSLSKDLQKRIDVSGLYKSLLEEKPDAAVNLNALYRKMLRYDQYYGSVEEIEAQDFLNFVYFKNKENFGENFARAIEISMLLGSFMRLAHKQRENLFNFIASSSLLFENFKDNEQQKQGFCSVFSGVNAGEQLLRNAHGDSWYNMAYQLRVIDYLKKLIQEDYNKNIVKLTGLYFLKLYFTKKEIKDKFKEGEIFIADFDTLKNSEEYEAVRKKSKALQEKFEDFQEEQKKLEKKYEIKDKKEQEKEKNPKLTPWQTFKNKTKSPYFYIPVGIGLTALIAYIYKNWEYFKNRFGK